MDCRSVGRLVVTILVVGSLFTVLNVSPATGELSHTPSSATAQGAEVRLSPGSIVRPRNAQFTVDVVLQQGTNVAGFEDDVTFDQNLVELVGTAHTNFLMSSGRDLVPVGPLTNTAGVLSVGAATCPVADCGGPTSQTRVDVGVNAPGTLHSLTFRAIGAGSSTIGLQNVLVVDPNANLLTPVTTQNANVEFTIPAFDVDADGEADVAVYRPSLQKWFILKSTTDYDQFDPIIHQWGDPGDKPVVADFDGDGRADLGLYRPSTAFWYILLSSTDYDPLNPLLRQWGASSDNPVVGDFDGDGKVDFGVHRPDPTTHFFFLLLSTKDYDIFQPLVKNWGEGSDIPLIGDFDGDGQTDFGVYRPSTRFWFLLLSSRNYDIFDPFVTQWGDSTDIPVVGDFDGDAQADFGVFRPDNTFWYLLLSTRGYDVFEPLLRPWGEAGDQPIVGDFDADGQGDFGVFRDSIRFWFILLSSTDYDIFSPLLVAWGDPGDITIPFPQPTTFQLTQ